MGNKGEDLSFIQHAKLVLEARRNRDVKNIRHVINRDWSAKNGFGERLTRR